MDESKRDPREDIYLIRQVLERTMDGMKSISPWFTGFGMVWLIYGGFCAFQRLVILRVPLSVARQLSFAGAIVGLVYCCTLAAGFLICRRRMTHLGLDSLVRKLVDMWGVCIVIFLFLTMLLSPVIQLVSVRVLGFSAEHAASLNKACALCRSFLFILLPVVPLLITAVFLDNQRMLWAGIILAALTAPVLCCHAFMLFADGMALGNGWQYFWFGAACILDLAPGVMLLFFGRQLKGR